MKDLSQAFKEAANHVLVPPSPNDWEARAKDRNGRQRATGAVLAIAALVFIAVVGTYLVASLSQEPDVDPMGGPTATASFDEGVDPFLVECKIGESRSTGSIDYMHFPPTNSPSDAMTGFVLGGEKLIVESVSKNRARAAVQRSDASTRLSADLSRKPPNIPWHVDTIVECK